MVVIVPPYLLGQETVVLHVTARMRRCQPPLSTLIVASVRLTSICRWLNIHEEAPIYLRLLSTRKHGKFSAGCKPLVLLSRASTSGVLQITP